MLKVVACLAIALLLPGCHLVFSFPANSDTDQGTGTDGGPDAILCAGELEWNAAPAEDQQGEYFQLCTAAQMKSLALDPESLDQRFKVMKHIPLAEDQDLIGGRDTPFNGTFDGNHQTLSGLTLRMDLADDVGLFASTGPEAVLKDIHLAGVLIETAQAENVGALVAKNQGTISGCSAEVSVHGGANDGKPFSVDVGGLVGFNTAPGTIEECFTVGVVQGGQFTGGLVGRNGRDLGNKTEVRRSYSHAVVSGELQVGGLVGSNGGNLDRCFATGRVRIGAPRVAIDESLPRYLGGLAGQSSGPISNCYATGRVGKIDPDEIQGEGPRSGGLIGHNEGKVSFSYAMGRVEGREAGGLVGLDSGGEYRACLWNIIGNYALAPRLEDPPNPVGEIHGKLLQELSRLETYTDRGWDIETDLSASSTKKAWWMPGVGGPPVLAFQSAHLALDEQVFSRRKVSPDTMDSFWVWGSCSGDITTVSIDSGEKDPDNPKERHIVTAPCKRNESSETGLWMKKIHLGDLADTDHVVIQLVGLNSEEQPVTETLGRTFEVFRECAEDPADYPPGLICDILALISALETSTRSDTWILGTDLDLDLQDGIASIDNTFRGIFDGNGFQISNATLEFGEQDEQEDAGLFRVVEDGQILNLGLVNHVVSGLTSVGGLVGTLSNSSEGPTALIRDCYVVGGPPGWHSSIQGIHTANDDAEDIGGLVGRVTGPGALIDSCFTRVELSTDDPTRGNGMGGLVGDLSDYTFLINSTAEVSVEIQRKAGGLVGGNEGEIGGCSSTARITATRQSVGGLVGENEGLISYSSASGLVETDLIHQNGDQVGGLVGHNNGSIFRSHASGDARGYNDVGGLIGEMNSGAVERCYATGTAQSLEYGAGGLIGNLQQGQVQDSYATAVATGISRVGGLIGEANNDGEGITVLNSYAAGEAHGETDIGGLFGDVEVVEGYDIIVDSCFASTAVKGIDPDPNVGWLVGREDGFPTFNKLFFDRNAACINADPTITMCNKTGGTGEVESYFWDSRSTVFGTWDFEHVWLSREGQLPVLR